MTFLEAQEALHNGKRIRHESMPDGEWIMEHLRWFGSGILMIADAKGNLTNTTVDFVALFWATLTQDDDGWEIKDGDAA